MHITNVNEYYLRIEDARRSGEQVSMNLSNERFTETYSLLLISLLSLR